MMLLVLKRCLLDAADAGRGVACRRPLSMLDHGRALFDDLPPALNEEVAHSTSPCLELNGGALKSRPPNVAVDLN